MNNHEARKQELMQELAQRFESSAEVMRMIAQRIGEAAQVHSANRRRLEQASSPLRQCVGADKGDKVPFSYLEFLEFSSDEFARFKNAKPITDEDIKSADWDSIAQGLLD